MLGAAGLASIGGYLYINGRGLQSPIPATVATPVAPTAPVTTQVQTPQPQSVLSNTKLQR